MYFTMCSIRRSHTPEVGLFASNSRPPELPTHRKQSPPTVVPRRGSPVTSRRQLPVDTSTPPKLPPKNNQQVYSEVPVSVNIVQLIMSLSCYYYSKP